MALKRAAASRRGPAKARARRATTVSSRLEFNHAMIYTQHYERSVEFYKRKLGFRLVDEYRGAYGRLQSPGSRTTIALHTLEKGQKIDAAGEGIRLYFEVKDLDKLCKRLAARGVTFAQMPKDMPWGWRHAYLRDPDGHELSLYWAGPKRFKKTTM